MRFHGVYQHDTRDCGAACLATICEFYGLKIPLSYVRILEKVDINGSSIYGICEAAKQLGMHAEAYNGDLKELFHAITETQEIRVPFIVHTIKEDIYHFIVVKKVCAKHVWIFDPAKGNKKISIKEFDELWTGYLITLSPTPKFKKENLKKGTYHFCISILKHCQKALTGVFFLSLLITGITIGSAIVFQHIIDHFVVHSDFEILQEVHRVFGILISLYIIRLGIYFLRGLLISQLSRNMENELIKSFMDGILKVPITYFDSRKNGEVLERLQDIKSIKEALSVTFINIILDILVAFFSGVIILTQSKSLFSITIVIIFIYIVEVLCFKKALYGINREIAENEGAMLSVFKETIDGFKTIKTFSAESYIKNENNKKISNLINSNYQNKKIVIANEGISLSLESAGILVLFWYGSLLVLNNTITAGGLLVIILLAQNMLFPIRNLTEMQDKIQRFIVSVNRLNEIFAEMKDTSGQISEISVLNNDLNIKDISFSYGYSDNTLKNISIKIHEKTKVAFIGKSGSGKTTLANLITGLRDVEKGEILIGSKNINTFSSNALHRKVSYVPQDIFLFSKSILDNLLLGRADISEEQLINIIHDCQLENIISKKEGGLQAILSENANNLSAGEKQRLGIARALLGNPDIIIFDEVTSNLDMLSEKHIIDMISNSCKNTTCIFTAIRNHINNMLDRKSVV